MDSRFAEEEEEGLDDPIVARKWSCEPTIHSSWQSLGFVESYPLTHDEIFISFFVNSNIISSLQLLYTHRALPSG